jgi:predicted short-subunit dehydrogenase-like oxidoreductase (DUF2520 family)
MKEIVILGSGNVAFHIANALAKSGISIKQIFGRNPKSVADLAFQTNSNYTTVLKEINSNADIYIFCMNDNGNTEIASKIKVSPKSILVHTAGSQSMNIFNHLTNNFGVFYPFQTFTKGVYTDFSKVPVCIETSNESTYDILKKLAQQLGCKTYKLNEKSRSILHLCGVFGANFMNHCVSISEDLLEKNNINTEIIKPLLEQSFYKIIRNGAAKSQTGPAIRNDIDTINSHLNQLKENKQYTEIYKVLTNSILDFNNQKP